MPYSWPTCPHCETPSQEWEPRLLESQKIVLCGHCGLRFRFKPFLSYDCFPVERFEYEPLTEQAIGMTVPLWVSMPKIARAIVRGEVVKVLARHVVVEVDDGNGPRQVRFSRLTGREAGQRRRWNEDAFMDILGEEVPAPAAFVLK